MKRLKQDRMRANTEIRDSLSFYVEKLRDTVTDERQSHFIFLSFTLGTSNISSLFRFKPWGYNNMKLNCLGCGNHINLGDEYEGYSGSIRCNACSAIFNVKLKDSKLMKMDFLRFATPSVEETIEKRS